MAKPKKEPGMGHNSELTADERSALRMHHIQALLRVDEAMKPLRDERKKIRSTAKGDGFKVTELDAGVRLATMEDVSIFVQEIHELIEIAKAFNALPPGEQGDMFPDRRPANEKAFDEGKVAGMEGKNPEPPYGADSKKGQKWLEGWHDGQRVMREDLQAAMEKRNAINANSGDDEDDEPFDAEGAPDEEQPLAAE